MKVCDVNYDLLQPFLRAGTPVWVRMSIIRTERRWHTRRWYLTAFGRRRYPIVAWVYLGMVADPSGTREHVYAVFWFKDYDDPYTNTDKPHESRPFPWVSQTIRWAQRNGTGELPPGLLAELEMRLPWFRFDTDAAAYTSARASA